VAGKFEIHRNQGDITENRNEQKIQIMSKPEISREIHLEFSKTREYRILYFLARRSFSESRNTITVLYNPTGFLSGLNPATLQGMGFRTPMNLFYNWLFLAVRQNVWYHICGDIPQTGLKGDDKQATTSCLQPFCHQTIDKGAPSGMLMLLLNRPNVTAPRAETT